MSKFINQFPYSDFHELNLDWLLKTTKQLQADMTAVQETLAQIEILTEDQINAMIAAAIASNNLQLYADLQVMKETITNEYKNYVTNQINQLRIYIDNQDTYYNGLAVDYANTAEFNAKTYTDEQVLSYTMMINPLTGSYDDVRVVVNDIITYFHSENSLTAAEYDALDMSADDYDLKELTAYEYDFNGKNLLP